LANHAGTSRVSIGFAGFIDEAGAVLVLFSEARGAGLAVAELAAEARGSVLRGGAFSDDAGPQPASPARSNRLRGSAKQGQTGNRDGLDRRMPSDLSGDVVNENVTGENTR
jgi:hypothetical protein